MIFFEVTFYVFITIIGINILYAIVVDTFIELREEVCIDKQLILLHSYSYVVCISTVVDNRARQQADLFHLPEVQF